MKSDDIQRNTVYSNQSETDILDEKEKYSDLNDFFKDTVSGEILVKYVCDKLDEKYFI